MDIELKRFNDPEYFESLVSEYTIKANDHTMDNPISKAICGERKVWIYTDPIIQTNSRLAEVTLNITGLKFSVGVCDDEGGYYIHFEGPLNREGSEYQSYFVRENGVWYVNRKTKEVNNFNDTYYPVVFDKEGFGNKFFQPLFCSQSKIIELINNNAGLLRAVENLSASELKAYLCGRWNTELNLFYYTKCNENILYPLTDPMYETVELNIVDIHKLGSSSIDVVIEPFKTNSGLEVKICDWRGEWLLYETGRDSIVIGEIASLYEKLQ